jgi:hypothetical protein
MYVYRNSVARSRNHWSYGNASLRSLLLFRYICRCQQYETHSGLDVKRQTFLYDFNQSCSFSTDFRVKSPISNLTKIRPRGAAPLYAAGRTDAHDQASSRFSRLYVRAQYKTQQEDTWSYTPGYGLLWWDAVWSYQRIPQLQKNIAPPSSGTKGRNDATWGFFPKQSQLVLNKITFTFYTNCMRIGFIPK